MGKLRFRKLDFDPPKCDPPKPKNKPDPNKPDSDVDLPEDDNAGWIAEILGCGVGALFATGAVTALTYSGGEEEE